MDETDEKVLYTKKPLIFLGLKAWLFEEYTLTNKQIKSDKKFIKEFGDAPYHPISETLNLEPTKSFLGWGTLTIREVARDNVVVWKNIWRPKKVKKEVTALIKKELGKTLEQKKEEKKQVWDKKLEEKKIQKAKNKEDLRDIFKILILFIYFAIGIFIASSLYYLSPFLDINTFVITDDMPIRYIILIFLSPIGLTFFISIMYEDLLMEIFVYKEFSFYLFFVIIRLALLYFCILFIYFFIGESITILLYSFLNLDITDNIIFDILVLALPIILGVIIFNLWEYFSYKYRV